MNPVSLREITAETVRTICDLAVAPEQRNFVAPNAVSIAQAYFSPKAWFRAIYAGEEPVGFLMLSVDEQMPEYFLWRLMIDARYQGRGYGRGALDLLVEHVRTLPNATTLVTSYVPGDAGPRDFYLKYGFAETGAEEDGERVIELRL